MYEDTTNDSINSDNAHFVSLLTHNYYRIHGFILNMVPNKTDAEDILQKTVTYMWEHFSDFETGTNFLAWAITIAKFQIFTYRKKQNRSRILLSTKALELIAVENEKLFDDMDERYEALKRCMAKLPKKEVDFLKLRYANNTTAKLIADKIGSTVSIVYKRVARLNGLLLKCIRRELAG